MNDSNIYCKITDNDDSIKEYRSRNKSDCIYLIEDRVVFFDGYNTYNNYKVIKLKEGQIAELVEYE